MRLIMSNLCRGWKVLIRHRGDFLGAAARALRWIVLCVHDFAGCLRVHVFPNPVRRCMCTCVCVCVILTDTSMTNVRKDAGRWIKVAQLHQCLRPSSAHHLAIFLSSLPTLSFIYFIASHQVQHSLSILLVRTRLWLESPHFFISRRAWCCKILWKKKKPAKRYNGGHMFCVSVFLLKAVKRELCNQRSNKPVDVLHCLSREWIVAPATAPQALQVNGRKLKFAAC